MPDRRPHSERVQAARLGAHRSWANTSDPAARTAPARTAFLRRFEHEIDPDHTLDETERQRRAESARKAYFTKLSLKSAQVRRRRRVA